MTMIMKTVGNTITTAAVTATKGGNRKTPFGEPFFNSQEKNENESVFLGGLAGRSGKADSTRIPRVLAKVTNRKKVLCKVFYFSQKVDFTGIKWKN